MTRNNNIENNNRIVYVDPNDIRGQIKNTESDKERLVPLTPDYTDYRIWCNLIVERSSRLKNSVERENNEGTTMISFDMSSADNGTNYVSFMQGKDVEAYNFLTTDYTNIDFSEIKKRNIIEGLQIDSVNISFVNYQTPQVTIKFVDIRGGGFFGREEATHDEYGHQYNLQSNDRDQKFDNLFGCFVTFPYPRFRLQVKGFYGKPVTFQLTCTSFNGNFNSRTGNFEMVVQFIGYEYGMLGDIPFDLLVAAPLTETGSAYWDNHVNDMINNKWCLDKEGKEAPCKLYDFYKNIARELDSSSEEELDASIVEDSTEQTVLSINSQINRLSEIKERIITFKQSLYTSFKTDYITECVNEDENVIIIYSPSELTVINQDICKRYNDLCNAIVNYNNDYKDNGGISTTLIPNKDKDGKIIEWTPRQVRFSKFIEHKTSNINGNDSNVIVSLNSDSKTSNMPITDEGSCCNFTIKKMNTNSWYTISPGVSKKIYKDLSARDWAIYGKDTGKQQAFASYAVVVDFGSTAKEIDDRITSCKDAYQITKSSLNEPTGRTIKDLVGFSPFVGRYFKVVMCHLETLVSIFNTYADNIYDEMKSGSRIPSMLGIKKLEKETDVPKEYNQVPPFPAVYKKYTTREEAEADLVEGKSIMAKAWIGDFQGDWQEKTMVEELFKAAQRISDSRTTMDEVQPTLNGSCDSVMPIDCYYGIPNYAYNTVEGAIFYAGLRAEIALNFMQNGKNVSGDEAEILGYYDGYTFANHTPNKAFIKTVSDDETFYKGMYDTCVYTNTFKNSEPHLYEFAKVFENRHPMFIENGGNVKYKYMTNNLEKTEFIPLENHNALDGVNGFAKYYYYTDGTDFVPRTDSGYFLVSQSEYSKSFANTHHFGVILDDSVIDKLLKSYNDLKSGKVKIADKPQDIVMNVLNKYCRVDNKYKENFYNNKDEGYYASYKYYGIDVNDINTYSYSKFYESNNPKNYNVSLESKLVTDIPYLTNPKTETETPKIPYAPSTANNEDSAEQYPFIHNSLIRTVDGTTMKVRMSNLFAHPFYYHQNSIEDVKTRNAVKALLFLHSLPFSYENLRVNKFKACYNNGETGGIQKIPYGYLLFLGGLIWRKQYVEYHNEDPIKYKYFFNETPEKDAPLFILENNKNIVFGVVQSCRSDQQRFNPYQLKYTDFINTSEKQSVDVYLLNLFNKFVENDFPSIIANCEINKIDESDNKIKDLDYSDVCFIARQLKGRTIEQSIDLLNGGEAIQRTDGNRMKFKINNFQSNYIAGWAHDAVGNSVYDTMLETFYSETNPIQKIFKNLFFKEVLATTIPHVVNYNGISKTALQSYFNGYVKSINNYVKNEDNKAEIASSEKKIEDNARDLKCEIYLTIKNIWDRWLCGYYNQDTDIYNKVPGREFFEVKNFFCNNFMFIDSFYNNIYDKLRLNCTKLKAQYIGGDTQQSGLGKTVVAHLGNVTSDHRCLMFNFPDNVNFSDTGNSLLSREDSMLQNMKDMFTPMSVNRIENPEYFNKFTIIYTHSAESLEAYGKPKFNGDSFDIWSYEDGTGVAPDTFKESTTEIDTDNSVAVTNEAVLSYKVPSFGIAYSRQNNSFWKNINVGMENFSVTEQAIRAEAFIAEKGNSEKHNLTFHGQDIYSVYQAYSYLVTVEMMGNAQIQPLMYFQLMNVPMFRGAYMIIKVEHSISQGNMTTTFTGMKMSKVQVPFATSWFTVSNDEEYVDKDVDMSDNGEEMTATDGALIDIEDNELSIAIKKYLNTDGMRCDDFVINVYNELGVTINNRLK